MLTSAPFAREARSCSLLAGRAKFMSSRRKKRSDDKSLAPFFLPRRYFRFVLRRVLRLQITFFFCYRCIRYVATCDASRRSLYAHLTLLYEYEGERKKDHSRSIYSYIFILIKFVSNLYILHCLLTIARKMLKLFQDVLLFSRLPYN